METISLSIISRDDQQHLLRLLQEMRPYVDEIVVVDTGSKDDSVRIAKDNGADKVIDASDLLDNEGILTSFSAARQRGLEACTKSWLLWLDTDDTLQVRELLRDQIKILKEKRDYGQKYIAGTIIYEYSWNDDRTLCTQQFSRDRIICLKDGWKWESPVHEYLTPVELGKYEQIIEVKLNELKVVHLSSGARGVSKDRNLKILEHWRDNNGQQEDPARLFHYLGDEYKARRQYEKAISCFTKSLESKPEFHKNTTTFLLRLSLVGAGLYQEVFDSIGVYGVDTIHDVYAIVCAMVQLKLPWEGIYKFVLNYKNLPPCETCSPETVKVVNEWIKAAEGVGESKNV
jgi:glycosyltransferase involved in cell wall biosynthesis